MLHQFRYALSRMNILNSDHVLVYVEAHIADVPDIPTEPGVSIRDLDHKDPHDIKLWLSIFNDAFGRRWRESQYQKRIARDRYIDVLKTLVLTVDGETSAVASIGAFRGNPACAALHYIAVSSTSQGRGLGPQIAAHGCRQLAELGYTIVENEIPAHRIHSLKMHHQLGFNAKPLPDPWNTPPRQPRAIQKRAMMRTHERIRQW
jgi:ribosomal protein S18 acetylase RimI-like enzyme